MRVLIAGLVGGIVLFTWGAVAHVALPLGEVGLKSLPAEEAVVGAMKEHLTEPGLYFFPGIDLGKEPTAEEEAAWSAKYEAGPVGLVLYQPRGRAVVSPAQLAKQFAMDLLCALVVALLLSMSVGSYGVRVALVGLVSLFGWLAISLPYWNWYGFPLDFTLAAGIEQVVGGLLAGLAMAAIVKPRAVSA